MASGKCIYLEQAILDLILGQVAWTPPTDVYVALSTSVFTHSQTGTGILTSEPTTGSYARVHIVNDPTNWAATDGSGQKVTLNDEAFPTVTASWGTIRSFYILDGNSLSGSDHCLYGADITATPVSSGPGPVFAAGNLIVKES